MSNDIILALDPFAKDQTSLKKAMATTKCIADALDVGIDPIAVVSPDQLQWPTRFIGTWASQFEAAARTGLKRVAASAGLKADKIEIVEQPYHSLKASVTALAKEAAERDPRAMVVITHHRKNPGLRLFGSFATGLLAKTRVPLIFVNAKAKELKSVKTILFATDFTKSSEKAYCSILEMATTMRAKVILFHALTPITQEVYANVGLMGGFANYERYLEDEERDATVEAERWIEIARKAEVECRFVLNHANFRASNAILESVKKLKADLVAVCSKTVGFEAYVLGSVTRDLIEQAKVPVIVIPMSSDETPSAVVGQRRSLRATQVPSARLQTK